MADETSELTQVQVVLDGLSSPTDEQFVQAVRGYSDGAVASAAAKLAMAGGGGGGAGSPVWTGPYTVTFEDIDPDNFNAVIATPEAGTLFLGGLIQVTEEWTVATIIGLAIGAPDDAYLLKPTVAAAGFDPGIGGLGGGIYQPGTTNTIVAPPKVVLVDTVGVNRILFTVDDIPDAGAADVYLCFVTPVAA